MIFYLDLEKEDGSTTTISIERAASNLAKKWSEALVNEINKGIHIPQPHRIYNLNNVWSDKMIISEINKCIDTVNNYKPVINDYLYNETMTQEDSNRLHHYFEMLRGENEAPNQFYLDAPKDVREVIEEFNILIHRWEDLNSPGRIVVHIYNREVYPLADEDFNEWNLDYQPGDVRLNYCHKGKPLWDVYKDGDEHVGDENIRPQFKYSADFSIGFNTGPGITQNYLDWWNRMGNKLNSLGLYQDDPKCAVGQAKVGKIIGDPTEVKKQIQGSVKLLTVRY